MRFIIIALILPLYHPVNAKVKKINVPMSDMPMKAIESPNSKVNLIMFVGGPGLKHGKLFKVKNPLIRAKSIFKQSGANLYFFPNPKKGKAMKLNHRISKKAGING